MMLYTCDGELDIENIEVTFNQALSLNGGGIYLENNQPKVNINNINVISNIAKLEGNKYF